MMKKFTEAEKIRLASGLCITIGVGAVVSPVFKALTPENTGFLRRCCIFTAKTATVWYITDVIEPTFAKQINLVVSETRKLVDQIKTTEPTPE